MEAKANFGDGSTTDLCRKRLRDSGIWWQESRNYQGRAVLWCREAVKFRDRLGSGANGGIPLWEELKSIVGVVTDDAGNVLQVFAAHSRANTQFVTNLLLKSLGYAARDDVVIRLLAEEGVGDAGLESGLPINKESSKWFGRVNPFNVDVIASESLGRAISFSDVQHVVDASVNLHAGPPETLMTNIGDRTKGMELKSIDLLPGLEVLSSHVKREVVAEPCPIWLGVRGNPPKDYWLQFPPPSGPKIGILTGNGPDSGRTLWADLMDALRGTYAYMPDVLAPEVLINSVPAMGISMELVNREPETRKVVVDGILELLESGCRLLTIACNTTIYFKQTLESLCQAYQAEFVSIADACLPAIRTAMRNEGPLKRVGLVGIGPVVDVRGSYSGYREAFEQEGIEVIPCPADGLGYRVKSREDPTMVTDFRRLMRTLPDDVRVVVLALTEVSMVYREHIRKVAKNWVEQRTFIDPLRELGRWMAYRYCLRGYLESPVCQLSGHDEVVAERLYNAFPRDAAEDT